MMQMSFRGRGWLLLAGLAVGGLAVQAQDTQRDPAELLKRSHESPRRYDRSLDVDSRMYGTGQRATKKEPRAPDVDIGVPDARRDSLSIIREPAHGYYPPPAAPAREEDARKKNWILPPQPKPDESNDTESDNPMDAMLQILEQEQTARREALRSLFPEESWMSNPREGAGSVQPSRYSGQGDSEQETSGDFQYTKGDSGHTTLDESTGYSPVITDTAMAVYGDTTESRQDPLSGVASEQLSKLSVEELAALLQQRTESEEDPEQPIGLEDAERMVGIESFTRGSDQDEYAGFRQTQSILSAAGGVSESEEAAATVQEPTAATLANDSWRGSLRTLSSVLSSPAAEDLAVTRTETPEATRSLAGSREPSPSAYRTRGQFRDQFGDQFRGASGRGGYTPAASSGLGALAGSLAGPTSLDLGRAGRSAFSPTAGFSPGASGLAGAGSDSRMPSFNRVTPSASYGLAPTPPPARGANLRNIDILMH